MVGIRTMAEREQYSMSSPSYTTLSYTYTVSYYRHRPTYPACPLSSLLPNQALLLLPTPHSPLPTQALLLLPTPYPP